MDFILTKLLLSTLVFSGILFNACSNKQEKQEQVVEKNESLLTLKKIEENSNKKTILFFGNSLTAGFGLEEEESFPFLIQERLDSLELDYAVINAGLSGETTSGGNSRVDWVLNQRIDIFVLELGGNDILRGIDIENTEKNLRDILAKVKAKNENIQIIIAGMLSPPSMGIDYTTRFDNLYAKLAKEYNAGFVPFLLERVAMIDSLNLGDGKHPNAKGQLIVRDNVWKILKDYL